MDLTRRDFLGVTATAAVASLQGTRARPTTTRSASGRTFRPCVSSRSSTRPTPV